MPDGGRAAGLARWTVALWCHAAALLSFAASAQLPPQITIEWTGSPLCPRSAGLDAEIARLLGASRSEGEPTMFVARVDELADRSVNYYRLSLSVNSESRQAERSVELATCTDVQDAAALLIASAIDPDAILRAKPPPPPPPPPPAPPEPEAEPEPTPPVVPARWSVRANAQFDALSLPGPSAGPTLGALLQYGPYRAWLDGQYLFPRSRGSDGLDTRVDLFSGVLGAAYVWPFGSFVVGPALGVEVGMLRTRSKLRTTSTVGLPQTKPEDDSAPWGGWLFGAVAGYAVERWLGLEAGLFAGVPVTHPKLQVDGADLPFYTTRSVTMRLALGLRVSLGSP
jgi:hypothetical protein